MGSEDSKFHTTAKSAAVAHLETPLLPDPTVRFFSGASATKQTCNAGRKQKFAFSTFVLDFLADFS